MVLLEHTKINTYTIDLEEGKQLPYKPIYSLRPIEQEILKIYIKTKLANSFIRPFESLASTLILFNKKSNGSLWLYIDY